MRRALALALGALLAGGCAAPGWVPGWVPFLGKGKGAPPSVAMAPPPAEGRPDPARATGALPPPPADGEATDRIVAVVNNDAITLGELQESIAVFRHENRGQRGGASDEELVRQFLPRLIDSRLQLQEAEREKIAVEEAEMAEELAERIRRLGMKSQADFERELTKQGLTMEAIRKRLRDSIRVAKVIRRKVTLRVTVTEPEIDGYLEANRSKLEAGLTYHARHILVQNANDSDAAWEAARIRAEMLRAQLQDGADFAGLARQHSQDGTARDGGDLGVLKRGELAQEIESAILALAPGEVSRPVRTALGYHLFRLEEREALEGEGLQRARQQIREILFREKYEARLDAWLKEIKQRAIIEVRL
jgi:peptidyl-prolyl cis-trans isomerase SurA